MLLNKLLTVVTRVSGLEQMPRTSGLFDLKKQGFEIVGPRIYYVGTTRNDDVVLEKLLVDAPHT